MRINGVTHLATPPLIAAREEHRLVPRQEHTAHTSTHCPVLVVSYPDHTSAWLNMGVAYLLRMRIKVSFVTTPTWPHLL